MSRVFRTWLACLSVALLVMLLVAAAAAAIEMPLASEHRIVVVLGDTDGRRALELVRHDDVLVYVQAPDPRQLDVIRKTADEAGLYGTRVFAAEGPYASIYLADNVADRVLVIGDAVGVVPESEVRRVLNPLGTASIGKTTLTKPLPPGIDDWSHPYHGPDNNPVSNDKLARAPYLTQFLAYPQYAPTPQVAVASAGRIFKAFGNVAFKTREEPWLSTLAAFNGYNGTLLWKRALTPGVMIHRNTLIATPDVLYLGDDTSCKKIDTRTGSVVGELAPDAAKVGGTYWKWMALSDGELYAVIGDPETGDPVTKWNRQAHGWSWNEISKGYNQTDPQAGFGGTLVALSPKDGAVRWIHHEDEPMDTRGVCMNGERIVIFRFGSYLACIDAETGSEVWRKTAASDPKLFETLGAWLDRQGYKTNWRTTTYVKCTKKAIYFAGPQLDKLIALSTEDGHVLWTDPYDNYQLILRDDAVYGFSGPWGNNVSKKFDPLTGEVLAELGVGRRACTRPTASIDSIFYRAMGGSVRFDLTGCRADWISPMRPPCQDGVTIANGMLYWAPYVCDCQLTLNGMIGLAPAGDFNFRPPIDDASRHRQRAGIAGNIERLVPDAADWPTFRANNQATALSTARVGEDTTTLWQADLKTTAPLTAPVAVGDLVFVAGHDGIVRALDAGTGALRWKAYTGGPIRIAPTIAQGLALVGAGDGWVYGFDAMSGSLVWRFRASPAERRIPLFDTISSTWPAASGVLVENGVGYVGAGLANYDGTYVYALDVETGAVRWCNDTCGHLDPEARTGVGVMGHMLTYDDKLYLAGGTAVSPAVFDIKTGRCLNDPTPLRNCQSDSPRGWELSLFAGRVLAFGKPFYAHGAVDVYDHTVHEKIFHAPLSTRDLFWIDNKTLLAYEPIPRDTLRAFIEDEKRPQYKIQHWGKLDPTVAPVWNHEFPDSAALAVGTNAAVIASKDHVTAVRLADGESLWEHALPAPPVLWGMALDREGRVVITLQDGQVVSFGTTSVRSEERPVSHRGE